MIVEYIRYEIADERRDDFEAAYGRAQEALQASTHCLGYELSHGIEEPNHYILRVEWDSQDGHLQGFREGPHFSSFLRSVRPFFGAIQEMQHYAVTEVRSE